MTKSRYCFALNFTEWLFLCISLLLISIPQIPLIVFAVLAVGLAVFLGFAALSAFNGKGFLLSHICIVSMSVVTFAYWLCCIIDFVGTNAIFPMLLSLLPCGAYFLGIFLRKKDSDLAPFYYKAVLFFSFMVSFFPYADLSLNLYTLIAAALGVLAYALFYSGRLNKTISAVFVGVDAGLAMLIGILITIDWNGMILLIVLPMIGFLAAGYYLLAFSKVGKKILGKEDSSEESAPQKQTDDDNPMSKTESLYKLYEAGILTDEEYQTQKDKILGGK